MKHSKYYLKTSNFDIIKPLIICGFAIISFLLSSCKKFVEVPAPLDQLAPKVIYNDPGSSIAALAGVYVKVGQDQPFTSYNGIGRLAGLYADELVNYNLNVPAYGEFYKNNLVTVRPPWDVLYNAIFQCNALIEGLESSQSLSVSLKSQISSEAKFMRALCYFYLLNMYGDVPLVTVTDYHVTAYLGRTQVSTVYEQIIRDLSDAATNLSDQYLDGDLIKVSQLRNRPNKKAALALLARAYLYTEQWQKAEDAASSVISDSRYNLPNLNQVFLSGSSESIWSYPRVYNGSFNTSEADLYILTGAPVSTGVNKSSALNNLLVGAFESGDNRKTAWIGTVTANGNTYYYPTKYKAGTSFTGPSSEEVVMLRLAEQYLIRAEARAKLGKLTGGNSASSDLNMVRSRAGLPPTTAITQNELLDAIYHERQVELFTEFGHRWFDIKRTKRASVLMPTIAASKGATWAPYKELWRIPDGGREIVGFPTLPQNPGYN